MEVVVMKVVEMVVEVAEMVVEVEVVVVEVMGNKDGKTEILSAS